MAKHRKVERHDFLLPSKCKDVVNAYKNLRKDCWSVQIKRTGLLFCHADALAINKPVFQVQIGGRLKVRNTGCKNVHAFICGKLCRPKPKLGAKLRLATYDPLTMNEFAFEDTLDRPMFSASYAELRKDGTLWVVK